MSRRQTTSSHSVVAELRRRTADAHAALERSDLVRSATLDAFRYARLIGAMFSFHSAIEREFRRFEDAFASRGITMSWRYKSALLREESVELRSPVVTEPTLCFETAAHAAGALYVMEGSTLGGTLIGSEIETRLQYSSRYYGCYGAQTAARWRTTTAQLEAFPLDMRERADMCAGAEATFTALHDHLTGARLG